MRHEIISSLEKIQDEVKLELQNVKTYRAFLAVDQAIVEISEIEEIVGPLNGIRQQVIDRLADVREYRALLAVQKSVADISEVLGILEESSARRAQSAANGAATEATAQPPAAAAPAASEPVPVEAQRAEPSIHTLETIATEPVHEAVAEGQSTADAVAPLPAGLTAVMWTQSYAQQNPPESATEATETVAAHAAHADEATAESPADDAAVDDAAVAEQAVAATAVIEDSPQVEEYRQEPAAEATETADDAIHHHDAVHHDAVAETEEIAKVA
jgi:hypothetical protein